MILNEATIKYAGYDPRELGKGSHKRVCKVCDICGRVRWAIFYSPSDLCWECAMRTDEYIKKQSGSRLGKTMQQDQRDKISKTLTGREKPYITRCRQSAAHQGVSLEDWEGFAQQKYCPAFNEATKERVRDKYGRLCFVCGKSEEENLDTHKEKLCVHHTDMNKQQGCEDHEWKLVPLCKVCHSSAHYEPTKARIEYIRYREEMVVILQRTETLK